VFGVKSSPRKTSDFTRHFGSSRTATRILVFVASNRTNHSDENEEAGGDSLADHEYKKYRALIGVDGIIRCLHVQSIHSNALPAQCGREWHPVLVLFGAQPPEVR
jgi:hypothetical protein